MTAAITGYPFIHSCPKCHKVIAREDYRHKSIPEYTPLAGAKIEIRHNEAPLIRCRCGERVLLLKGSL